ncbi:MAG: 50S ribosomal protein L29 [Candidatus Paceibacterota bacterium]
MANKKDNLKSLKDSELAKKLSALQEDIRVFRFKAEGSKSKNVKEEGKLKKQIARILTQMRENNINKKDK